MSPRGPIDEKDLDPHVRDAVRARVATTPEIVNGVQVGPRSPLLAARGAQSARKRQRVGKSLEQELEVVHQLYELEDRARIRKTNPATFVQAHDQRGPVLRYAKGGAPVDYSGSALIQEEGRVVSRAIAFDLKSWEQATYVHDPKQYHQIDELIERAQFGELAFLLLICAPMSVGYILEVDYARYALDALRRGQELLLRRPRFAGTGSGRRTANDPRAFEHLVPHFFAPRELLVAPDQPRWDWLTRLETLTREGK